MNRIPDLKSLFIIISFVLFPAVPNPAWATNGHFLHGIGAVHSSMGGASIGAAEDTLGAIFNNPATLADLGDFRVDFSFELFKPERTVESRAGAFSGETESESDFVPIPAFGVAHRPSGSRTTHGLGVLAIAGFGVDYPQDSSNPVLMPPPAGFGHVFSNYQLLKISPSVAYDVRSDLSLGFALNLDWASLGIEPMPIAVPDCSGPTACFYPSASNQAGAFGIGFQIGLRYQINDMVSAGFAYTSPQWFEEFEWNSVHVDPSLPNFGEARQIEFRLDVPQIIGVGVGWRPTSSLLLVTDVRWINYADTKGFDEEGFNPDGSVKGFGWDNIWVVGLGFQARPLDRLAIRGGYNYSQNPVPDELSFFNLPAPAIIEHHLTAGLGIRLTPRAELNLAYYHAFENSGEGSIETPAGPAPGTSVKNRLSEDSFLIQISYRY